MTSFSAWDKIEIKLWYGVGQ